MSTGSPKADNDMPPDSVHIHIQPWLPGKGEPFIDQLHGLDVELRRKTFGRKGTPHMLLGAAQGRHSTPPGSIQLAVQEVLRQSRSVGEAL